MHRIFVVLSLASGFLAAPIGASPVLSFTSQAVRTTGVTPGGELLVIGHWKVWRDWKKSLGSRAEIRPDQEHDGIVETYLDEEIAPASIWAAVDLATGAWSVEGPEGSPLRPLTAHPLILPELSSVSLRLRLMAQTLEVYLVRPGTGAWRIPVSDGGPTDSGEGNDGELLIDFGDGFPIDGTPEFEELAPEDVVLAFQPYRLEWFAARVIDLPRHEAVQW